MIPHMLHSLLPLTDVAPGNETTFKANSAGRRARVERRSVERRDRGRQPVGRIGGDVGIGRLDHHADHRLGARRPQQHATVVAELVLRRGECRPRGDRSTSGIGFGPRR
jgi:hypothetical protein